MKSVKATVEGLIGARTSSGYVIDQVVPFVALPSTHALGRFVKVTNPANGLSTFAVVLDVGPWNIHDDPYVFGDARPQAESGVDSFGRHTNGAGIDLGEVVRRKLGIVGSGTVEWAFIDT